MKKTNTGVATMAAPPSVESFISQAITANLPVDTMERLFALRKDMKAEAAKEAYIAALSEFQGACPIIRKTKKVMNKDGTTVRYMFAPLDSIVDQIRKPLADHGFSYRWETKTENGEINAICIVTHKFGHAESSAFAVKVDTEGYMTGPQKSASALTFAKRYSLCNALGISTGDEDTDATDAKKAGNAKSDKAKIIFLLRTLKQKTDTRELVAEAVGRLVQLDLEEANYPDIVSRLETLVEESHENTDIQG